jgi:hypothetical protein
MRESVIESWAQEIFLHGLIGERAWRDLWKTVHAREIEGFIPVLGASVVNLVAVLEHNSRIWGSAWLMVAAAGAVSRTLWPGDSSGLVTEAAELRAALVLPDLPMIRSRGVRNAIEHMDERAREWQRELLRSNGPGEIAG